MSDDLDFTALRARLEKLRRRANDLSEAGKSVADNLTFNLPHYEATFKSEVPGLDNLKHKIRVMMQAELAIVEADLARKRGAGDV